MNTRLHIVYGAGPDSVGLVGRIATPIAQAGGNIVNLRQDVLHGLFTVFLVVDPGTGGLTGEALRRLVAEIGEATELELRVGDHVPAAASTGRCNILLVLVGRDRPGIVATLSESLGRYGINIESAQAVGREDVFLMELLADISRAELPLANLQVVLQQNLRALAITPLFQSEDVYNKRRRVVLFDLPGSFIPRPLLAEIIAQAGLAADELRRLYPTDRPDLCPQAAVRLLDRLPLAVLRTVLEGAAPTAGTAELVGNLKTMGYKVALRTPALAPVADWLHDRLGLDHVFAAGLPVDDDALCIDGEGAAAVPGLASREQAVAEMLEREAVPAADVTVIDDDPAGDAPPGIRIHFDLKALLDLHNQRVLTREPLTGLLGAFGLPRH